MSRLSEAELEGFIRGDPRVFAQLVKTFSPRLFRWVSSFSNQSAEAEDLLQEVWKRVFARRHQFRAESGFGAWLFSIARSVCLDAVRKEQSRVAALQRRAVDPTVTRGFGPPPGLPELDVARLVMSLPDRQRQVVALRFLDQLSTQETAEAMGVAPGTVKATLHKALRNLRSMVSTPVADSALQSPKELSKP